MEIDKHGMESAPEIMTIRAPRHYMVYGYVEYAGKVQFIQYIAPDRTSIITKSPLYGAYHFIVDPKEKRIVRRPEKESEAFLGFVEAYEKPAPVLCVRKEVQPQESCEKKEEPKVWPLEDEYISLKEYPLAEKEEPKVWLLEDEYISLKEYPIAEKLKTIWL